MLGGLGGGSGGGGGGGGGVLLWRHACTGSGSGVLKVRPILKSFEFVSLSCVWRSPMHTEVDR